MESKKVNTALVEISPKKEIESVSEDVLEREKNMIDVSREPLHMF